MSSSVAAGCTNTGTVPGPVHAAANGSPSTFIATCDPKRLEMVAGNAAMRIAPREVTPTAPPARSTGPTGGANASSSLRSKTGSPIGQDGDRPSGKFRPREPDYYAADPDLGIAKAQVGQTTNLAEIAGPSQDASRPLARYRFRPGSSRRRARPADTIMGVFAHRDRHQRRLARNSRAERFRKILHGRRARSDTMPRRLSQRGASRH